MSNSNPEAVITISLTDLEALIQRTVRQAVREELIRLLRKPITSILDDVSHEGPDDPEGDAELLADALVLSRQYDQNSADWKTLEEFEAELARVDSTHELPR